MLASNEVLAASARVGTGGRAHRKGEAWVVVGMHVELLRQRRSVRPQGSGEVCWCAVRAGWSIVEMD
jgi:hypothetical protein